MSSLTWNSNVREHKRAKNKEIDGSHSWLHISLEILNSPHNSDLLGWFWYQKLVCSFKFPGNSDVGEELRTPELGLVETHAKVNDRERYASET